MAQQYQWTVPCTICATPVEHHCNTCGDVLCSHCLENHRKSNATMHHDVVPYSERVVPIRASLQCGDHPGYECLRWCHTCSKAVCIDCIAFSNHGGHQFLKIEEKIGEKRKEIQNQFQKYLEKLTDWQKSLQEAKKITVAYENDMKQLDKQIIDRADEICEQVRAAERSCREKLQEMKDSSLTALQSQQQTLADGIRRLKERIAQLEDTLRSNDTSAILQFFIEETIEDTKPSVDKPGPLPVFTPGSNNIQAFNFMFGWISKERVPSCVSRQVQDEERLFLLDNPSVESVLDLSVGEHTRAIACMGSAQAWIRTSQNKLKLIDTHGGVRDTALLDFEVFDIAVSPQGDVLLPDLKSKCIKSLSKDGKMKVHRRTKWPPFGICCLLNREIAVTFLDGNRVILFSSSGKIIKELDRSLFRSPWYVTHSQANKQLYVCDKSDDCSYKAPGKVLALDMNGTLQCTYTGSDPATFTPVAVCADQAGHLLITDYANNTVHILDRRCILLQYLLTGEQGLILPTTISVDSEGYAWINEHKTGKLKIVKYMDKR